MNCFQNRRTALMSALQSGSVVIIAAAATQLRNGDVYFPFRQDSYFYYLTGFNEPRAILVMVKQSDGFTSILFCQKQDPVHAQWQGSVLGPDTAQKTLGIDHAFADSDFAEKIPMYLNINSHLHMLTNTQRKFCQKVQEQCAAIIGDTTLHDVAPILSDMRLLKDQTEITLMQRAADISCRAHLAAMRATKPDMLESHVEGILLSHMMEQGCRHVAYESIVAGGNNACTLHYTQNNMVLNGGDLLLIDAGVECEGYAADITRTFPVSGVYSEAQRALYQMVLDTQRTLIDMVKPGVTWSEMQYASERSITQGLVRLGILSGNVAALMRKGVHKAFYMHGFGHWLGIDVHDVGSYGTGEKRDRPLEPGMVLTIEPGVYIRQAMSGVDARWQGIGIRIEDDILVTEHSCRVLTTALPKSVEAIESIMRD